MSVFASIAWTVLVERPVETVVASLHAKGVGLLSHACLSCMHSPPTPPSPPHSVAMPKTERYAALMTLNNRTPAAFLQLASFVSFLSLTIT